MTTITEHPVRLDERSAPQIDLKRIRGTYQVTTSDGAQRRVTIDRTPAEKDAPALVSSEARVLVQYIPWGVEEFSTTMEPMTVYSIVALGLPWNHGKEDSASIVVTSILPVAPVGA